MKPTSQATLCTALVVASFVVSCKQEPKPAVQEPPAVAAPAAVSAPMAATAVSPRKGQAGVIFKTRCVVCHGENGKGDGPGAAALKVKPRNYTDVNWQKAATDQEIGDIIVKGGGGVGKDPGMPPNPDLESKPEVVAGLVKIIRSFGPSDAPAASAGTTLGAAPSASGAR